MKKSADTSAPDPNDPPATTSAPDPAAAPPETSAPAAEAEAAADNFVVPDGHIEVVIEGTRTAVPAADKNQMIITRGEPGFERVYRRIHRDSRGIDHYTRY